MSVATDFALEAPLLRPLPDEAFETGTTLTPRVDRHSRVSVRKTYYSVPARFIGARLRTLLRADEVLVFDGARVVARHERSRVRGGQVLAHVGDLAEGVEIVADAGAERPLVTAPEVERLEDCRLGLLVLALVEQILAERFEVILESDRATRSTAAPAGGTLGGTLGGLTGGPR